MEQRVNEHRILDKMKIIQEKTPKVFEKVSQSYRQKVVYNLLNIVRSGDMKQFLFTLLRLINARADKKEATELIEAINCLYAYSSKFFEKWAYTIIMGIMSVKEKNEEVSS